MLLWNEETWIAKSICMIVCASCTEIILYIYLVEIKYLRLKHKRKYWRLRSPVNSIKIK